MTRRLAWPLLLITILFISPGCLFAQKENNWTADQLMAPADLAKSIVNHEPLPIIISIGPGAIIPHSIDVGMVSDEGNMQEFINTISKLDKDSPVVIYCGCCPFDRCPNVRPAIDELNKRKFTHFKLLNLPKNIKSDWISKGYPVVD